MLSPLSYDDVVPRPGIEPGVRRLEGGAVVLHTRLESGLLLAPRQRVERCTPGFAPRGPVPPGRTCGSLVPRQRVERCDPESESRAWVPPGGARVCWSRQRESHSRSARTGRVSYCWTMTASVLVLRSGGANRTRTDHERGASSLSAPAAVPCVACWCPRKGSNLRLPEVSRVLVHRAAWAKRSRMVPMIERTSPLLCLSDRC